MKVSSVGLPGLGAEGLAPLISFQSLRPDRPFMACTQSTKQRALRFGLK